MKEGYYWVKHEEDWTIGQYLGKELGWELIEDRTPHGYSPDEIGNKIERQQKEDETSKENLAITGVNESFTKEEAVWMLFYGQKSEDSKKIDDYGRIDLAVTFMFNRLEDTAIDRILVEGIFWNRITYFLNSR